MFKLAKTARSHKGISSVRLPQSGNYLLEAKAPANCSWALQASAVPATPTDTPTPTSTPTPTDTETPTAAMPTLYRFSFPELHASWQFPAPTPGQHFTGSFETAGSACGTDPATALWTDQEYIVGPPNFRTFSFSAGNPVRLFPVDAASPTGEVTGSVTLSLLLIPGVPMRIQLLAQPAGSASNVAVDPPAAISAQHVSSCAPAPNPTLIPTRTAVPTDTPPATATPTEYVPPTPVPTYTPPSGCIPKEGDDDNDDHGKPAASWDYDGCPHLSVVFDLAPDLDAWAPVDLDDAWRVETR